MPHFHSPPPPNPPGMTSDKIDATFGMAVTVLVLVVLMAIGMTYIGCKLNKLYALIPTVSADKPISETLPQVKATPASSEGYESGWRGEAPAAAAPAVTSSTQEVAVEMVAPSAGTPVHIKLAHSAAILVAGLIAVAVGTVLADGTSVIKLKGVEHLKVITNPDLKAKGLDHRLDELLGPTYGIGLHHDQSGNSWTEMMAGEKLATIIDNLGDEAVIGALPSVISTDDLKHPVPFLSCDSLQVAGLAAMSFGFIAEAVALVMIIFHALALAELLPSKIVKPLAALVWLTLSTGFLVVIILAVVAYATTWDCKQSFVPKIRPADHFDYNYGFAFAIVGYVSALLVSFIVLTLEAKPPGVKTIGKIVGGVSVGITIAVAACLIVMGGNDSFSGPTRPHGNPCEGQKPYHATTGSHGPGDNYFANQKCFKDAVTQTLEQAGANVTKGYKGGLEACSSPDVPSCRVPITKHYTETDLCPVNVHWHEGAEHLSVGQYDTHGKGPTAAHRQLAGLSAVDETLDAHGNAKYPALRQGNRCHHYDATDAKFTNKYDWKYCKHMEVGETYEIHWPHSAAGACGTEWQYQSPFYDGVFCNDGIVTVLPLNTYEKIGVQGQVFTVVNDESYRQDNLIAGALRGGEFWKDVAIYTGSTTGTSRDNQICSRYTPITWQVDRKCHMISASSFDQLCKDMKAKSDDMSDDLHPHGSRETVAHELTANNQQSRK